MEQEEAETLSKMMNLFKAKGNGSDNTTRIGKKESTLDYIMAS